MFKIVGFTHLEGKGSSEKPLPCCDNCGHDIRNIFTISDEQNRHMRVGSECVLLLTANTDAQIEAAKITKRMERASRQWRENKPVRLDGETREQYINRRISEMANAMIAHKYFQAEHAKLFTPRGYNGYWSWTHDMKVAERGQKMGLKIERTAVIKRHSDRIAMRFRANPFDFRKPTWDVAKI